MSPQFLGGTKQLASHNLNTLFLLTNSDDIPLAFPESAPSHHPGISLTITSSESFPEHPSTSPLLPPFRPVIMMPGGLACLLLTVLHLQETTVSMRQGACPVLFVPHHMSARSPRGLSEP